MFHYSKSSKNKHKKIKQLQNEIEFGENFLSTEELNSHQRLSIVKLVDSKKKKLKKLLRNAG